MKNDTDKVKPEPESVVTNKKQTFAEKTAERLIKQLEAGTAPWQLPWEKRPQEPDYNPTTGKAYRGGNALLLAMEGRADPRWMTYKQAQENGYQVRKGEKGTVLQHYNVQSERIKRDENGSPILDKEGVSIKETIKNARPTISTFVVFNGSQIDGLEPLQPPSKHQWQDEQRVEDMLQNSGAKIDHTEGSSAFYRPASDSIHLPSKDQFSNAEKYYATVLHELGHWTGHESRLNRDMTALHGSEEYAKEELRAEIASMMIGRTMNIVQDPEQHAAYVGSWIKALQDDPTEIFKAAREAEKIHTFVMEFDREIIKVHKPEDIELEM